MERDTANLTTQSYSKPSVDEAQKSKSKNNSGLDKGKSGAKILSKKTSSFTVTPDGIISEYKPEMVIYKNAKGYYEGKHSLAVSKSQVNPSPEHGDVNADKSKSVVSTAQKKVIDLGDFIDSTLPKVKPLQAISKKEFRDIMHRIGALSKDGLWTKKYGGKA
jgi:hypothetical protein